MKKGKKNTGTKKEYRFDSRVDSAIDFALKHVLRAATDKKYPITLRANFTKIAFDNLCEVINKLQARKSVSHKEIEKVFEEGLEKIEKIARPITDEYIESENINIDEPSTKDPKYLDRVLRNQYDVCHIDYEYLDNYIQSSGKIASKKGKKTSSPKHLTDAVIKVEKFPELTIVSSTKKHIELSRNGKRSFLISIPQEILMVWSNANMAMNDVYSSNVFVKDNNGIPEIIVPEISKNGPIFNMVKDIFYKYNKKFEHQSVLLDFPTDTFYALEYILEAAVRSTKTIEIGMTGYRLGNDWSRLLRHIVSATKKRITCKVFIEVSARGEAYRNIDAIEYLVKESDNNFLEVKSHYNDIKVHGKMIYINFLDDEGEQRTLSVFSTGNYNSFTANIYKDYHYVTTDESVAKVIHNNFNILWNQKQPVLSSIAGIIRKEIFEELAKKDEGRIWIQTNHLDNEKIVSSLKEAFRRKVDTKLIVRTTKGFTKKELPHKTVVGKYLEHARVYIFGKENPRVYISSSDLIHRNLFDRFESYVLVVDENVKETIINNFADLYENGQR